jgi:hypothetical protein
MRDMMFTIMNFAQQEHILIEKYLFLMLIDDILLLQK